MKKIFGYAAVAAMIGFAACNSESNDKEAQLAVLKDQQAEIQEQIEALEA